jgi:hypothetical protein
MQKETDSWKRKKKKLTEKKNLEGEGVLGEKKIKNWVGASWV